MHRLFLTVAILAISPACVAMQSFASGCMPMDGQFYGEDKVGFYCMNENEEWFDYKYSTIDLGHCLANNNGDLVGFSDGNYQKSCSECTLESVHSGDEDMTCYIKCKCHTTGGDKADTKLDLDDVLANDYGRLACFAYRGTRETEPPECHQNIECSTGVRRLTPRAGPTPFVTAGHVAGI